MTELAIVAIFVLAISLVIYITVTLLTRGKETMASPRPWETQESALTTPTGTWMQVSAIHPGTNERIVVSSVKCDTSDFMERMIDARILAEDRVNILNAGQKRLKK